MIVLSIHIKSYRNCKLLHLIQRMTIISKSTGLQEDSWPFHIFIVNYLEITPNLTYLTIQVRQTDRRIEHPFVRQHSSLGYSERNGPSIYLTTERILIGNALILFYTRSFRPDMEKWWQYIWRKKSTHKFSNGQIKV